MTTDQQTAILVDERIPDHIKEHYEKFVQFLKSYYDWLDQEENVGERIANLYSYFDVDTSIDEFIEQFQREFMVDIPESILTDKKILIKHIKQLYQSKGSEASYQLLFRILFNEEISFYYPSVDILRTSSGLWVEDIILQIVLDESITDTEVLLDKTIFGQTSNAQAKIESIKSRTFPNEFILHEFVLLNIKGNFQNGEIIHDENDAIVGRVSNYIGGIFNVRIEDGGRNHNIDDLVEIVANIDTENENNSSKGKITSVMQNGIIDEIEITESGENYSGIEKIEIKNITNPNATNGIGVPIIEGLIRLPGKYLDENGRLSDIKKIRDNNYYQEYSYDISSNMELNKYQNQIAQALHPAGTKLFGTYKETTNPNFILTLKSEPINYITWDKIDGLAFVDVNPDLLNRINGFNYTDGMGNTQSGNENTIIQDLSDVIIRRLSASIDTINFGSEDIDFDQFTINDIIRIDKFNTTDFFDILPIINSNQLQTRFIFSLDRDFTEPQNDGIQEINGRIITHQETGNSSIDISNNTIISLQTRTNEPTSQTQIEPKNSWKLFVNNNQDKSIHEISPYINLPDNSTISQNDTTTIPIANTIPYPINFISSSLHLNDNVYLVNNLRSDRIIKISNFQQPNQITETYLANVNLDIVSLFETNEKVCFLTNENGYYFMYEIDEAMDGSTTINPAFQFSDTLIVNNNTIEKMGISSSLNVGDRIKINNIDSSIYAILSSNTTIATLDGNYPGSDTAINITIQKNVQFPANANTGQITSLHYKNEANTIYGYDTNENLYFLNPDLDDFTNNRWTYVKTYNDNQSRPIELFEYEKETLLLREDGKLHQLSEIANTNNISQPFIGQITPENNNFRSAFSIPPSGPYFKANTFIINLKKNSPNSIPLPRAITTENDMLPNAYNGNTNVSLGNGLTYNHSSHSIDGTPTIAPWSNTFFILQYDKDSDQENLAIEINVKNFIEKKYDFVIANPDFRSSTVPTNCYIYTHTNIFDQISLDNSNFTDNDPSANTLTIPITQNIANSIQTSGDYTLFVFSNLSTITIDENANRRFNFIEQQSIHKIIDIDGLEKRLTISPIYIDINNPDSSDPFLLEEGIVWKAEAANNVTNTYENIIE